MVDETLTEEAARCPWCSAELPTGESEKCPSCGAQLLGAGEAQVPGLTAVDAAAIVRSRQAPIRPRSRLLSWLSGDDDEPVFTKAEGEALAPPDPAVKREMLRLELEAEVANLQAENDAAIAEAAAEGRIVELPTDLTEPTDLEIMRETPEDIIEGQEADEAVAEMIQEGSVDVLATPEGGGESVEAEPEGDRPA